VENMERRICIVCQCFFVKEKYDQKMCKSCQERDKEDYKIVKEYLMNNHKASIMNIYLDTKIPIKTIERFLNEERISFIQ